MVRRSFRLLGSLMLLGVIVMGGSILVARWRWTHGLTVQLTPVLTWETHNVGSRIVEFTPDAAFVATQDDGHVAQVTLKRLTDSTPGLTFQAPGDHISAVTIDPTGEWLAAICRERMICIWTLKDAHLLRMIEPPLHDNSPFSFRFGPQPTQIQVVQADLVTRWDVPRLTRTHQVMLQPFPSGALPDAGLAISAQGTYVAKHTRSGTVYLWDGQTGAPLITLTAHTDWVTELAFSPDEQVLATASYDRTIRIWHLPEGRLRHTITTIGESALAFSPDGTLLASGDGQEAGSHGLRGNSYVFLWDTRTGARVGRTEILHRKQDGFMNAVRFSANGQLLGSTDTDGIVHVWTVSPLP